MCFKLLSKAISQMKEKLLGIMDEIDILLVEYLEIGGDPVDLSNKLKELAYAVGQLKANKKDFN